MNKLLNSTLVNFSLFTSFNLNLFLLPFSILVFRFLVLIILFSIIFIVLFVLFMGAFLNIVFLTFARISHLSLILQLGSFNLLLNLNWNLLLFLFQNLQSFILLNNKFLLWSIFFS